MAHEIIRKVKISRLQLAVILLLITGIGSFLYFNSSASSPTQKPPYPLGCETGSTNINSAAALRTAVSNGQNACVTAAVGNVDLSGINRANSVYVGTSSGSIGAISIVGSKNIVIKQARVRSVDIRDSQFITIEKSTLGGTSSGRVLDNIITSLGYSPGIDTSDDVTIQDNDIGWTTADTSGNTGYGIRVYGGDRFKVQRNYIHHIGADGIQMGSDGKDNVIDRNEFAYIAPPPSSDEHSDDIQITGHGPNLRITNNYLHHNGWLDSGGAASGGSGPYIHGGSTGSLLFENNLVRDERNYMQVADLGTGGTSISNLTFRRNTFFNNGTMWPNPPDLSWQINSGTNNLLERNVVNDNFGNKYGFGTHTSANNNLNGAAYTIDNQGECTVTVCNPASQETIGYRCPTDVWWCSNSTTPPPPLGTSVANIWVDTNGGSCTRQQSPVAYTVGDAQSCSSLNAAYLAASPGDSVLVASGIYTDQYIGWKNNATSPNITMQPASNANVIIKELDIQGTRYLTLKNFRVEPMPGKANYDQIIDFGQDTQPAPPSYVTLDGITMDGRINGINQKRTGLGINGGASYITIINSDFGFIQDQKVVQVQNYQAKGYNDNITFDNVKIHDDPQTAVDEHLECFWASSMSNSTLSRLQLYNCALPMILSTTGDDLALSNVTIENSVFEPSQGFGGNPGYYSIDGCVTDHGKNGSLTLKYNYFGTPWGCGVSGGYSGLTAIGNIGPENSCKPGVTYRYNVWNGAKCDQTDKQFAGATEKVVRVGTPFRGGPGDYGTSSANSPQIDAGRLSNYPA